MADGEGGLAAIHHRLRAVGRAGSWVCGALLLTVSLLVVAEVFGRNALGSRLHGAEEIAGYVFAITVAWGFAVCVLERGHIRLDVTYRGMQGGTQRLWDVLSLLSLLILAAVLAEKAWGTFAESWNFDARSTTILQVPLWIPQALWTTGMVFFALAALFMTVYAVVLMRARAFERMREVAGIPGAEDRR